MSKDKYKESEKTSVEEEKGLSPETLVEVVKAPIVEVKQEDVLLKERNRKNKIPRSEDEIKLLISNLTSRGMKMDEAKKIANSY